MVNCTAQKDVSRDGVGTTIAILEQDVSRIKSKMPRI